MQNKNLCFKHLKEGIVLLLHFLQQSLSKEFPLPILGFDTMVHTTACGAA